MITVLCGQNPKCSCKHLGEFSRLANVILKLRMSLYCSWWTIITFLGWSLLGKSDDFSDPMKAADFFSESLARILYASFLIMGVILLINMLIALLSNTYQRIEVRCQDKKNHSLQSYLDTELLKYEHNTLIAHFWVHLNLSIKARPGAQPFIWKWV